MVTLKVFTGSALADHWTTSACCEW